MDNMISHPTVAITIASALVLFLCICLINPRSSSVNTISILAHEDIIYKSKREEMLTTDIAGKEIKYINSRMTNQDKLGFGIKKVTQGEGATKALCILQVVLFSIYLRNDHTLLSLFARTSGTNYSAKQRLKLLMYLCTIMAASAVFYGIEQSTVWQDIGIIFDLIQFHITCICGEKVFEKSRPRIALSTIERVNSVPDEETELERFDTKNMIFGN